MSISTNFDAIASDDPALPFEVLLQREGISVVWQGDLWCAEMGPDAFNEWDGGSDRPTGHGATPREAALACLRNAKPPADVAQG